MTTAPVPESAKQSSNITVAVMCVALFSAMVGMSYAAVPLYKLFCQVTGFGGTTQRVEEYSDRILDRTVNVRFDANTVGIPWDFKPMEREVTLRIGETKQISYLARNISTLPTHGTATFNVTPLAAGAYFNKVECFCFTETELQPGSELDMPVVFYIDPDIVDAPELKGVGTITLSYTFFPIEGVETPVAAAPVDEAVTTNSISDGNLGD